MTDGPHRKAQFSIYSTMLIIAFLALVIATVFAYLETTDYGANKTKGAPPVTMAAPAQLPCPAMLTAEYRVTHKLTMNG